MADELFDLDAAKAAQRETLGEPFQFSFAGEKYEIPPSMDWPIEVFTHMATKDFRAAMPTLGHFDLVFDEIARREGLTDASDLPHAPLPGSPPT
jgi:hypothetical protein